MARIDRYMLSQLLVLFGFFSLILVLVYWVNRAVILFEQLISEGQTALVFLEFTALSLPNVIRLALPISAFAASVYVTNRLSSESELTAMQATGYSLKRLARPVLFFGLFVTLLLGILTNVLVPAAAAQLKEREAEIAQNITAGLLREGVFQSPTAGITLYIRDITPSGELIDLFLSDRRDPERSMTYTARRAFLVRSARGPQLVMVDGMAQTLNIQGQRLFTTRFDDFSYDIAALIVPSARGKRSYREVPTLDLLRPSAAIIEETGRDAGFLVREGHQRIGQPLLAAVAALIGFATLVSGGFSRFGVWRQIVAAIFLLILVKTLESVTGTLMERDAALWPLTYAPAVVGLAIAWALLWKAGHPALFKRRRREAAA